MFGSLPVDAVASLLEKALEDRSDNEINDQLRSHSKNAVTLARVQEELERDELSPEARTALGNAAGGNVEGKKAWFKSVSAMEDVGREIILPHLANSEKVFKDVVVALRNWCVGA